MAEPINLNKARKAKVRADKEKRATQNRVKFGRTKAEKASDMADQVRLQKQVDQSKLDS